MSCDSSPAALCCSFLSMCLPHIPSGAGEPQWPLSVVSLSFLGIPKEYLLLVERECHGSVTNTVVCHGSTVEGFWNCAELKRRKSWKASSSAESIPSPKSENHCQLLKLLNYNQWISSPKIQPMFPTTTANHWASLQGCLFLRPFRAVSTPFQGFLCILSGLSLYPFWAFSE